MAFFSVYAYLGVKVVALIFGVYFWKKLDLGYKVLLAQVLFAFIAEAAGKILSVKYYPNAWVFNIYMLIEFLLLSIAASLFITRFKKIVIVIISCFVIAWVLQAYNSGLTKLFNWLFVLSSLGITVMYAAILFMHGMFTKRHFYSDPLFLVCVSIVVFFACIIPLFGLLNYLIKDDIIIAKKLYLINVGASIFRYSLVAIAFYLYGRQAKRAHVA